MNHGLNSMRFRRGATMLISILVFFLAALSGTVALTMAASNAGRYTHEKDDQQAYFSVASAAKLILNRLSQAEVQFKSTEQEEPKTTDNIEIQSGSNLDKLGLFFSDESFEENVLKSFALEPGGVHMTAEFDLTVENHAEIEPVHVILLVQGGDFFFEFYIEEGEIRNYQLTMRVAANFENEGAGNWVQNDDDNYYYRTLKFDVEGATFINELLTDGAEE